MFGSSNTLVARFLGGINVGTLEGDEWRRHRKVILSLNHHYKHL